MKRVQIEHFPDSCPVSCRKSSVGGSVQPDIHRVSGPVSCVAQVHHLWSYPTGSKGAVHEHRVRRVVAGWRRRPPMSTHLGSGQRSRMRSTTSAEGANTRAPQETISTAQPMRLSAGVAVGGSLDSDAG